ESTAGVYSERGGCGRRFTRIVIHGGAVGGLIEPADPACEVFGSELERREWRILSNFVGNHLIDRRARLHVLGNSPERYGTAQPRGHADSVTIQRIAEFRNDRHPIAE